jgi:hypothetical protein
MTVCDSSQGIVEGYITFGGCAGGRWEKGGTVRAGGLFFLIEKGTKIINLEQEFCTALNIISS